MKNFTNDQIKQIEKFINEVIEKYDNSLNIYDIISSNVSKDIIKNVVNDVVGFTGLSDDTLEFDSIVYLHENKVARATTELADFYLNDNPKKAVKLYKQAAEQGDRDAQCTLGVLYENGSNVEKNTKEAAKWYKLAAKQGDADAQYSLAFLYHDGDGVKQNFEEAVKWFRCAAEQKS
jgi:TPR repeat protein